MSVLRHYAGFNWAIADQAMVSGANFVTTVLLARFLGLEEFGRFTLWLATVYFVNSLHYALIVAPMMSIGPKRSRSESPAYYAAVFLQQCVFAALVFFLMLGGVAAVAHAFPAWDAVGLALPIATATALFQTQDFVRRYLFVRGHARAAFADDMLRYFGQVVGIVLLFRLTALDSASVFWLVAVTSAAAIVLPGLLGWLEIPRRGWGRSEVSAVVARHWRFGKWLVASTLPQWTVANFFLFVAASTIGAAAAGLIKAAQNILGLFHVLFLGLDNVLPAQAASSFQSHGRAGLLALLRRVGVGGGGIAILIMLFIVAFPESWVVLLYGVSYQAAASLLPWFAAAYVLMFCGLVASSGLRAVESTRPIFRSYAPGALVTLLSAHALIGSLGIQGAAVGTFVVQAATQLVLLLYLKRELDGVVATGPRPILGASDLS